MTCKTACLIALLVGCSSGVRSPASPPTPNPEVRIERLASRGDGVTFEARVRAADTKEPLGGSTLVFTSTRGGEPRTEISDQDGKVSANLAVGDHRVAAYYLDLETSFEITVLPGQLVHVDLRWDVAELRNRPIEISLAR